MLIKIDNKGNKIWNKIFNDYQYIEVSTFVKSNEHIIVFSDIKGKGSLIELDNNGNEIYKIVVEERGFGGDSDVKGVCSVNLDDDTMLLSNRGSIRKLDNKGNEIWKTKITRTIHNIHLLKDKYLTYLIFSYS